MQGLRVLRQIAESGSFIAAAARLGYTQSAVSRPAASLERSAGTTLLERRPDGVRFTPAGLTLLRHAHTILDVPAGEVLVAPQPVQSVARPYRRRTTRVARPRDRRSPRRNVLTGTRA